jgi:predicted P-loop ATPase
MSIHVDPEKESASSIPPPDPATIREHILMVHSLATSAGVDGVLTLTRIDDKENCFTERFKIGDPGAHADAVIAWASNGAKLNLYVPWCIFAKNLPQGSKGAKEHVAALLAPVGDIDSDQGKTGLTLDKLPVTPPYVVETSRGNFHATYPLSRALLPEEAKRIAVKLKDAIGCDGGTGDISHLWRVPGTLNWPNETKLARGRPATPQLVTIKKEWNGELVDPDKLWAAVKDAKPKAGKSGSGNSDAALDWTKVIEHAGWLKGAESLPIGFSEKGMTIVAHTGDLAALNSALKKFGPGDTAYPSWSHVTFALAAILKRHGKFTNEQVAAALLCNLPCNRHITGIRGDWERQRAVTRAVLRSYDRSDAGEPEWNETGKEGAPKPSFENARRAIEAIGVACSRDTFHNKTLFGYSDEKYKHELQPVLGEVSDDGIVSLRTLLVARFGFDFTEKHVRDAVVSLALENCFDPVRDMIDAAQRDWDGTKRLARMAPDYFNSEDTPLNRAFARKMMIGLIKRAREPGCKFDTIVVLESDEGFNKSTAWRVLAGDENFSDERVLGKHSREVQEQLADIWVHENADLAGLKKADVDSVKAYASRQYDIARPAYGRFVTKQPRHSIEVGTTNATDYLQSQNGNRRFWPMKVLKPIDIAKLSRDMLQLIGEAATYQANGESVVLDKSLWKDAGDQQEARRMTDPWEDKLAHIPEYAKEKYFSEVEGKMQERAILILHHEGETEMVVTSDLLEHVLGVPIGRQSPRDTMRLSPIMKRLGWGRNGNRLITVGDKRVAGYFRPKNKENGAARVHQPRHSAPS